jgi:hypothetical protein
MRHEHERRPGEGRRWPAAEFGVLCGAPPADWPFPDLVLPLSPSTCNDRLFWAACRFGEMVAEGLLSSPVAKLVLTSAAHFNGPVREDGLAQVRATNRKWANDKPSTAIPQSWGVLK